ncbi:hypothetical protein ACFLU6_12660 [Acidobacteriota bacterium]
MRTFTLCIGACLVIASANAQLTAQQAEPVFDSIKITKQDLEENQPIETYRAEDRRDPFVPNPTVPPVGPKPPRGLAGQYIDFVTIIGVSIFGDIPVAILRGTDGIGHTAREGSNLYDGSVLRIDFEEGVVVFEQRFWNDHGRPAKREIKRCLSP